MHEFLSLTFIKNALLASALLSLILSYFGLHVVVRRIVFVDLALAQIASLGVAVALWWGKEPYLISLIFTFLGAMLFSVKIRESKIPHEALMGIIYAAATAISILIISKTPHGEADILNLFFGNILTVNHRQIIQMAVIFITIGIFHIIFFKNFYLLSFNYSKMIDKTKNLLIWEIFFYLSLALVIVIAIRIGGVLLVFSYLIIPSVSALIVFKENICFVLAPLITLLGSFIGIYLSFKLDLPTGPAIVTVMVILLLALALLKYLGKKIF